MNEIVNREKELTISRLKHFQKKNIFLMEHAVYCANIRHAIKL